MECIKLDLPIQEPANLLRGCSINPTITEETRRFNACVFGEHKKTTFNSGLVWPVRGGLIPSFKCVESMEIIKRVRLAVKRYGNIFILGLIINCGRF